MDGAGIDSGRSGSRDVENLAFCDALIGKAVVESELAGLKMIAVGDQIQRLFPLHDADPHFAERLLFADPAEKQRLPLHLFRRRRRLGFLGLPAALGRLPLLPLPPAGADQRRGKLLPGFLDRSRALAAERDPQLLLLLLLQRLMPLERLRGEGGRGLSAPAASASAR